METPSSKSKDEPAVKDVYKDAFLTGVAVTPSITFGADKASQDIMTGHFNSISRNNS